jgi:hypothetical protein
MLGIYRQKLFYLGDRPFNLQGEAMVFFSFRIFFSDNTRVRILIFFVAQRAKFCFQILTLGYMTKTLNQIIFCSSTKIRIFFQQHWESEYFFRKKQHNPTPWKLNGPSLVSILSLFLHFSDIIFKQLWGHVG